MNSMKKYVDFLNTMATDDILEFGLGDWCPPTGGPAGHKCPIEVTSTAYYYVDVDVLSKVAGILGKKEDMKKYAQLAERIRKAFHLNSLTRIVDRLLAIVRHLYLVLYTRG